MRKHLLPFEKFLFFFPYKNNELFQNNKEQIVFFMQPVCIAVQGLNNPGSDVSAHDCNL